VPKIKPSEPGQNEFVESTKPAPPVEEPRPKATVAQPKPHLEIKPAVQAPTFVQSKPAMEIAPPTPIRPTIVPPVVVEEPKVETPPAPAVVVQQQPNSSPTPARNANKPAAIVRHPLPSPAAIAQPEKVAEQKSPAAAKIAAAPVEKPAVKPETQKVPEVKAESTGAQSVTITGMPLPPKAKPAKRSLVSKSTWGEGESAVTPTESVANTPSAIPTVPVAAAPVEPEAVKPHKPSHITRVPNLETRPRLQTRTASEGLTPANAPAKIAGKLSAKPEAAEEIDVLPPPTVRSSVASKREIASAMPVVAKANESAASPNAGDSLKVAERTGDVSTPKKPNVEMKVAASPAPSEKMPAVEPSAQESTEAVKTHPASQSSVVVHEFRPPTNSALGGFVSTHPRTQSPPKNSAAAKTPVEKPREATPDRWIVAQKPASAVPQNRVPAGRPTMSVTTIDTGKRTGSPEVVTARAANADDLPPIVSYSEYSARRSNPAPASNYIPVPPKSESGEPAHLGGWINTGAAKR
jgi:hypothetical protein